MHKLFPRAAFTLLRNHFPQEGSLIYVFPAVLGLDTGICTGGNPRQAARLQRLFDGCGV